jgi:ribonuclease T1
MRFKKYLLGLIVVLSCIACTETRSQDKKKASAPLQEQANTPPSVIEGEKAPADRTPPDQANDSRIPPKVYKVLAYIVKNNAAPDGYVGGRTFQNRERRLPDRANSGKKIKYQEWDVNPKKQGVNRGAERLVTGSDNRYWYTRDHYDSFIEVKLK